jgi:signal peptidase
VATLTRVLSVARWTASLVAGLAVLATVGYAVLLVAGFRPVAVYSGSMRPTIPVGGLAIDRPVAASALQVGDVVTFSDPYVPGRLVTHRIARIIRRPGKPAAFRTKGDANSGLDPWTITLPHRVGLYRFEIPYVGYALVYARTREVRMLLILVGAGVLLWTALWAIWKPRPGAEEAAA